jgi:hypothetical protein
MTYKKNINIHNKSIILFINLIQIQNLHLLRISDFAAHLYLLLLELSFKYHIQILFDQLGKINNSNYTIIDKYLPSGQEICSNFKARSINLKFSMIEDGNYTNNQTSISGDIYSIKCGLSYILKYQN